ncbi:MAG: Endoribonuclease VapD [Firmicutes bacterium]|nr:Endoribonuclease VapD [Bacillota bacterium]
MSKYLITFDMDTNCLKHNYHGNNWNNAYSDIAKILREFGFEGIQGSVYLGAEGISEAHGTLALQKLTANYDWFYTCISNIRFYRLKSDLNAQFIVDGVYLAKQQFLIQMEAFRIGLLQAGLTEAQINQVLKQQSFDFQHLAATNPTNILPPGK